MAGILQSHTLYGGIPYDYTGRWDLVNNANDSTGTYNGTATNVTFNGSYASFNGSSSCIDLGIINAPFASSKTFSVSMWVQVPSTTGNPWAL